MVEDLWDINFDKLSLPELAKASSACRAFDAAYRTRLLREQDAQVDKVVAACCNIFGRSLPARERMGVIKGSQPLLMLGKKSARPLKVTTNMRHWDYEVVVAGHYGLAFEELLV